MDRHGLDDDQLPWLQSVEDEQPSSGISAARMFGALSIIAIAAAAIAGTFFWLGNREAAGNGPPELITAPPAPYKVKPKDPGGLDVSGESETAFETSAGEDRDSQLDLDAVQESPVERPPPKQIPPNETREPVPAEGAPKLTPGSASGSTIQLGAFANQAQAERAWSALAARFPTLAAMTKMVVPFQGGIRLRAAAGSAADARAICQTLKAAGESCFVAQ
jgi:hypothetical protein